MVDSIRSQRESAYAFAILSSLFEIQSFFDWHELVSTS